MEQQKEKVYMVCDWHDGKAEGEAWNIGVEHMGNCAGRILKEDGTKIGYHYSSTFGWLRYDLKNKLDNPDDYEIIDLIGKEVPEKFRLSENGSRLAACFGAVSEANKEPKLRLIPDLAAPE